MRLKSFRYFSALAAVGASAAWLVGCALVPPNSFLDPTKVGRFPLTYQEGGIRRVLTPKESPGGIAGATAPTPDDLVVTAEDYRIGPYDQVAMQINDLIDPGTPWSSAQEVNSGGYIRIPDLGLVKIAGLTEAELERDLSDRLREAEKLPNPVVQALVQVKRNTIFSVLGDVREPGTYPITQPDTRLLDIIPMARDIGPNVKRLYVIRKLDRGTGKPAPAAPGEKREKLIIPPPTEDDGGMPGTFSAGWGTRAAGSGTGQEATRAELEEVAAPGKSAQRAPESNQTPDPRDDGARPRSDGLAPLIYDPVTGKLIEAPPAGDPPVSGPAPDPGAPSRPFRWEDVPEIEVSQRVIEIDVAALLSGDPSQNIVIRDRDVVRVPVDTGLFYLMGEVNRPGVYGFNGREVTLKQALGSIGGGLTPLAWPQRCEIIRRDRGADKQITIPVNMDAVYAGLQDDVLLQDDDLVNVGTHTLAPFLFVVRNSFRFTYGFGFVYDRNFADKDAFGSRLNPEIRRDQQRQTRGLPF